MKIYDIVNEDAKTKKIQKIIEQLQNENQLPKINYTPEWYNAKLDGACERISEACGVPIPKVVSRYKKGNYTLSEGHISSKALTILTEDDNVIQGPWQGSGRSVGNQIGDVVDDVEDAFDIPGKPAVHSHNLSPEQQRTLRREGRVTWGGKEYTQAEIDAYDQRFNADVQNDREKQRRLNQNRGRPGRFLRSLLTGLTGTIVRLVAGMYMLYEDFCRFQDQIWDNYLLDHYGQHGTPEALTEYRRHANAAHVAFIAEAVALWIAGVASAVVARRIITAIRAAFTAAGVVAGAGVGSILTGAIGFIIGTGVSYGVMWLISRQSFAEAMLSWMINKDVFLEAMLTDVNDDGEYENSWAANASQWAATTAIDNPVSNTVEAALGQDLDYAQDMNPQERVNAQGIDQRPNSDISVIPTLPAAGGDNNSQDLPQGTRNTGFN